MAELITVIDVVVPAVPVVSVASVGMQGPPGAPGPAGPAGPQGPAGVAGPHQATHAVGGSDPVTGPLALSPYVSVGVNPSQGGSVRLPNTGSVTARNAANTGDIVAVTVDGANQITLGNGENAVIPGNVKCAAVQSLAQQWVAGVSGGQYYFGDAGLPTNLRGDAVSIPGGSVALGANPSQSGAVRLANNQSLSARHSSNTADVILTMLDAGDRILLGQPNYGVLFQGYTTLFEMNPAFIPAPAANSVNLWAQDNGSGKTQLMCRFNTGAAIQIAIEP